MPLLDVCFLPEQLQPEQLTDRSAVMIDLLRASTTIVHALAAGTPYVRACETVEEARELKALSPPGQFVLGGERGGVKIAGFDLGNSPLEYTSAALGKRVVVLTTTNGTRALWRCKSAAAVYLGALVNATAVARQLQRDERDVVLLCAGTNRLISREDVLCAGAIAAVCESEFQHATVPLELTDAARIAWDVFTRDQRDLAAGIANSHGGRNLLALGYQADISRCAELDRFDVVPQFNPATGEIRLLA